MRTHRKAPSPLSISNHPTHGAADNASSVQAITAHTRVAAVASPPLAATQPLRRSPLRRMPTELVVTTRMPPVRHTDQPSTGVRSVTKRASQPEPAFARAQPQAPAAAMGFHHVGHTLPYTAQSLNHEQYVRAVAARPSQAARPSEAAPPPNPHAAADALAQEVRRELTLARESARQSEHRAMQAELRAVWAERYVPHLHDAQLYHSPQSRGRQRLWLRRVLQISLVGLALGGYVSLLVPLRDRVVAQNAMIDELTQLQKQLRAQKQARAQGSEELASPSAARGGDSAQP